MSRVANALEALVQAIREEQRELLVSRLTLPSTLVTPRVVAVRPGRKLGGTNRGSFTGALKKLQVGEELKIPESSLMNSCRSMASALAKKSGMQFTITKGVARRVA